MQGHRLLRGVGVFIIIVAFVYLLLAIGGALWLGRQGLGDGWGTGWTGWLTLPLAGGAVFAALTLLVFGLMLFFLAKIDSNIAEAERRRAEMAARPRVEPAVAASRVATVNLPSAPVVEAPAAAAAVAATGAVAAGAVALAAGVDAPADERVVESEAAEVEAGSAPWQEPVVEVMTPEAGAEAVVALEPEAPTVSEEEPALADDATILPSVEIEGPGAGWGVAAVAATGMAAAHADDEEPGLPADEITQLDAEALPAADMPDVELSRIDVPDAALPEVELPTDDASGVQLPEVLTAAVVVDALDADLADVDMPAVDAAGVDTADVNALAFAEPEVEPAMAAPDYDDLNVPPVLPHEIELPRIDVSTPEADLETDGMEARGIGLAGLALGAAALASQEEPAPEPEAVDAPVGDTRLPEIEISEVSTEADVAPAGEIAAAAALAAATGVPESEAVAPAAAPEVAATTAAPEAGEVAQLKAEVASLKEMLAQLAAQLLPAAGVATAGAAVAAGATAQEEPAPRSSEPAEAPAAVDPSSRLPGTDEVARIAAEVQAASPRRPRTVAKPAAPEAPTVEAPAPVASAPETREAAPVELPAAPAVGEDNLEMIDGLGPIYAKRLRELGVTTYAQLAEAPYDVLHKVTRGNLERVIKEDWRGQARRLAKKE
jgi:predicted flap endonuclease-1-like 5' DNA nuclease